MASFRKSAFGSALLLTAVAVAPACDDDPVVDDPTGGSGGSAGSTSKGGGGSGGKGGATGEGGAAVGGAGSIACEELGEICHPADADPMGAECHDIGHVGNGPDCLEAYDDCIAFCMAYVAGGAGGGASHGGAGGHGGG